MSIQDQPDLPALFAPADLRLWVPSQVQPVLDAKRLLDIAVSLAAVLFLLPLLSLIAIAVALDSRGPVLFCQRRRGRNGEIFGILKFRTMRVLEDGADVVQARKHDDRITRVGRVLRATSLDELPQLINVLKGEMSLVGPRPVTATELAANYGAAAEHYQLVRPGITGPWQVSGRSETSYDRRVALDVAYATQPSLVTDIRLLLATPAAVLLRRGAY